MHNKTNPLMLPNIPPIIFFNDAYIYFSGINNTFAF